MNIITRWIRKRTRLAVMRRRALPRFFVIVDFSPFRGGWKFMASRGMDEARRKCRQWVRQHPFGKASITDPEGFRSYYAKYRTSCFQ